MGSIYRRGDSRMWWLAYRGVGGQRVLVSSGTADEAEARSILADVERGIAAQRQAGLGISLPLTVRRYALQVWLPHRRERRPRAARREEVHLRRHILPTLGGALLVEVDRRSVLRWVERLMEPERRLAPRTVLGVYGTLRLMYRHAVDNGVRRDSPCTLRDELPANEDCDQLWRDGAVFTREEVELLISSPDLWPRERALYALLFLTGMRIGEAVARRWRDYDAEMQPLGRLVVGTSYNEKHHEEGSTKTGKVRRVPVHPTLAAVLAQWRLSGWPSFAGRAPNSEDLIIPPPVRRPGDKHAGRPRKKNRPSVHLPGYAWKCLQEDLGKLGLRRRRIHDTRATFVTLARDDGAREEILRWITHPPRKDVIGLYTRAPSWPLLCGEVARLNIRLRGASLTSLPSVSGVRPGQSATPGYGRS